MLLSTQEKESSYNMSNCSYQPKIETERKERERFLLFFNIWAIPLIKPKERERVHIICIRAVPLIKPREGERVHIKWAIPLINPRYKQKEKRGRVYKNNIYKSCSSYQAKRGREGLCNMNNCSYQPKIQTKREERKSL